MSQNQPYDPNGMPGQPTPEQYGAQPPQYQYPGGYAPQYVSTQPGESVGPVKAVSNFFRKYAQFSGRASRSEYWWMALIESVVYVALCVFIFANSETVTVQTPTSVSTRAEPYGVGVLGVWILLLLVLAVIIPNIALHVRRLHDGNFSGWLYLLVFIPFFGGLVILVFMVLPSKPEGARFDKQPLHGGQIPGGMTPGAQYPPTA